MNRPASRSSSSIVSLGMASVLLLAGLTSALFISDPHVQTMVGNAVTAIAGAYAAIGCGVAARASQKSPALVRAWRCFAFAMVAWCLGTLVFSCYELVLRKPAFPSWADPIYLCYYPLLVLGILAIRAPGDAQSHPKAILDTLTGFLAGILGFGRLIVEPLITRASGTDTLTTVLAALYPALDLAVIWALFGLVTRGNLLRDHWTTYLIAAGCLTMMVADCLFGYQNLTGTWNSGQWIDSLFALSLCLFGLAGVRFANVHSNEASPKASEADDEIRVNPWKGYVPLAVLIVILLSIAWLTGSDLTARFLYLFVGSALLVSVVLARMLLTLRENHNLLQQVRETTVGLRERSAELEEAHILLQVEFLRRGELERQRREFSAKMVEMQKLESLGVLAGGVAHDFNNLLTALLGNLSLVKLDLPPNHPVAESLHEAERAAMRAADLTQQMLAYSGKGGFAFAEVDMNELTCEMAGLLRATIPKKVRIRLNLSTVVPSFNGDATQIRQVVANLILNAAESITADSGEISLRSGVVEADSDFLASSALLETPAPGRYVFLEVQDTGCGMPPDVVARIFEPFFSTKFTGRGLGLAATHGIIRGHHGVIHVSSQPQVGTRFLVAFPVEITSEPAAPPCPPKSLDFPSDVKCGSSAPISSHEAHPFDSRQSRHPRPALLENRT